MNLEYKDIILRHEKSVVTSRSNCDITATLGQHTFKSPLVCANMASLVPELICKIFDSAGWFYVYHRIGGTENVYQFAKNAPSEGFNITSISVGVTEDWVKLIAKLYTNQIKVDYFTVDVALSYNDNIIPVLKAIRRWYPDSYVICGNGATGEWIKWLEGLDLVDCAKVGVGVSAACRTRQFTGFGSTTVSSLSECVSARKNIKIMSDGGVTVSDDTIHIGDVAKALAIGADFVMSGVIFSRCIDSPSLKWGYFGNASERAKKNNNHIEGTTLTVESNGLTIIETMKLVEDSLRSSVSYAGGTDLSALKKVKIQSLVEVLI